MKTTWLDRAEGKAGHQSTEDTPVPRTHGDETPVIFRRWRSGDHDVLALFPTIPSSPGLCSSYQHVGQHGSADYRHCIRMSTPARPDQCADLMAELEGQGYDDLRVYRREQRWMGQVRHATVRRMDAAAAKLQAPEVVANLLRDEASEAQAVGREELLEA